jgi:hypothetical protein
MRRFCVVILWVASANAATAQVDSARHSARASSSAERVLFRLEDDWTRGLVRRDPAIFHRLLAPGWVYTDERGTFTVDKIVAEVTTGSDTVTFAANEGMRAHIYGRTAAVTGILVTRGRGPSGPFEHRYRYTDTWVARGATWLCIASQDYDIPKP